MASDDVKRLRERIEAHFPPPRDYDVAIVLSIFDGEEAKEVPTAHPPDARALRDNIDRLAAIAHGGVFELEAKRAVDTLAALAREAVGDTPERKL